MSTLAWVLLCCSWLIVVHADTDFLSPPQSGLNITHDCSYVIKWSSSWGAGSLVSLVLWQYTGVEWDPQWLFSESRHHTWHGIFSKLNRMYSAGEIPDPGDYTWSATTVKGNPVSEMMHFELCLGPCANESTQAAIDSGRVYVDGDGATCPGGSGSTTSSTSTTSSISTTPAVLTPSSAAEVCPVFSAQHPLSH